MELHIIVFIFVLNLPKVSAQLSVLINLTLPQKNKTHGVTLTPGTRFMINSAATIAFDFPTSFGLTRDIRIDSFQKTKQPIIPEEKLSVEIAYINCIHVNDMNILEASKGQISQDLTSKSSCSDYQDSRGFSEKFLDLYIPEDYYIRLRIQTRLPRRLQRTEDLCEDRLQSGPGQYGSSVQPNLRSMTRKHQQWPLCREKVCKQESAE